MRTTLRILCLLIATVPLAAQEKRPGVVVVVDAERGALVRWAMPAGAFPAAGFQLSRVVRGGAPQIVATIRPGDPANAPGLSAERMKIASDFLALANDTARLQGEDAITGGFALRLIAASDPDLAAYLGISYADRNAPRAETVTYIVSRIDGRGVAAPYGMSAPTRITPMRPPDPPADFRAVPTRDGVAFYWTKPLADANASEAATYEIHKRESGRSVAVTPQPVLRLSTSEEEIPGAMDLEPATERIASYTIRALDLFGRRGPETALDIFVPDFKALDPPMKVVAQASGGKALVTWEAPANANRKGWKITRSTQPNGLGPVLTPAPITGMRFVDDGVTGGTTYYYRVSAVNRRDEVGVPQVSAALPMRSARPPAGPTDLRAEVKNGRVILTWTASSDVVAGYHVERSAGGREWSLVTSVAGSEPRYVDRLPAEVTGTLRYRVVAWSRDDKPSAPSAVLEVPLPDRQPPQTPIIQSIDGTGGKVTLRFLARGGTGDAARYLVVRSDAIDEPGDVIGTGQLADRQEAFVDNTVLSGSLYFYRLVAVDSAGNRSRPSDPPAAIRPGTPPLPRPAPPAVRLETRPFRRVSIRIPVSPDESVLYAIERRQGDGRWQWIQGPLPASTTQAFDNTPPKRGSVSYRLVAMSIDGTPGPVSDEVTLRID